MEKLSEILKDLEQGKISADNEESKVLSLFSVSGSLLNCQHDYFGDQHWLSCKKCGNIVPNGYLLTF